MRYSMTFSDIATGAVADTFKTIAALIVADTAGHRMRLRSLSIGNSDAVAQAINMALKISRIEDVSAGLAGTAGSTVATTAMAKKDPSAIDSVVSGALNYSVEPTAYAGESLYHLDINTYGSFIKEWAPDDAPIFTRDMLCGLLAAPRTATAGNISGTLEFETF